MLMLTWRLYYYGGAVITSITVHQLRYRNSLGARPFLRGGRGKRERGLETLAALPCAFGMSISGRLVILEVIKKEYM